MGGAVIILLALWLGVSLTRVVPLRLYRLERWAWAVFLGLFAAAWIVFLVSLILPYSLSLPFGAGLVAALALILQLKSSSPEPLELRIIPAVKIGWWFLSGSLTLILYLLLDSHNLQVKANGWFSGLASWGDIALHATLVSHFANASSLHLNMPILSGSHLSYPFLVDFLSGALLHSGWTMQAALTLPAGLLAASLIQLLFFLGYRLFHRAGTAILGTMLFLFNGSLGGITIFINEFQASHKTLFNFLSAIPKDYSNMYENNTHFSNVISTQILPQRGVLLGIPAFGVVMALLIEAWHNPGKRGDKLLWAAGLITGFLPLAHAHTFLVVMAVFGWLAFIEVMERKTLKTAWVGAFLLATLIALPQLYWEVFSVPHLAGFSYWHLGWVKDSVEGLLPFFWRTFGIGGVFMLVLPFLLWRQRQNRFWLAWYLPFLALFIFCNVYVLQPWPYDNFKIISYTFLAASFCIAWFLQRFGRNWLRIGVVAVVVAIMTLTGGLSILKESQSSYSVFSNSDIAFGDWVKNNTGEEALFLAPDRHNHPVTTLGGRQVVMGFRGWLWTYGLNYAPIEKDAVAMFRGGTKSDELVNQYGVDYVVLSKEPNWDINRAYFLKKYTLAYQSDDGQYTVLKVR